MKVRSPCHQQMPLRCTNIDIPKIVSMRERCPFDRPPLHITVPMKQVKGAVHVIDPENIKTIPQLIISWKSRSS
ncbi:hypothetical protein MKX01_015199 [Papaver californicum]|nr:hypothetical protein MKX01_015199 [Papaver californicum]